MLCELDCGPAASPKLHKMKQTVKYVVSTCNYVAFCYWQMLETSFTMDLGESLCNFSVATEHSITNTLSLAEDMILRNINIKYRDACDASWIYLSCTRDAPWSHSLLPEANSASSSSEIPCLNCFRNVIGHVESGEIICFRISRTNSLIDMVETLAELLQPSIQHNAPMRCRMARL